MGPIPSGHIIIMGKKPYLYIPMDEELKEKIRKEAKELRIPMAVLVRLKLEGKLA
jgi:hypothetical protein